MITLYNVISEDWFIAETDGSEDFIPDELWSETLKVYEKFDVLAMGRKTYETIQSYPAELYESLETLDLRKIVITSNIDFQAKGGYEVAHAPEDAVGTGDNVLVSSGPTLNNYLLQQDLVSAVILHRVPVRVAEGITVFESTYRNSLILESESDLGIAKELIYRVD